MKKIFTLFLALVASVGIASAQSGTCGGNLKWRLSNGTLTISGTGSMINYTLYKESPWYDYRSSIQSVIITDGVTSIGDYAFWYCESLTSVTIPNSVTSIGESAFDICTRLTSVTIPNSVTRIGEDAFNGCSSLTSVTIPNSVTSIGNGAFSGCSSLSSITIPNSVKSIGSSAFSGCSSLTSITIPKSVTSIGDYAFYNCSGLTSITIPNRVTSIGNYAFCKCSGLTSVTIGNSVTSIGERAFEDCKGLTSVTIPNSVTSIGEYAFRDCTSLTSINVETNNPNYCSVEGVLFNKGKTTLIVYPGGKQGAYTIPNSVTGIGWYAFSGCTSLTSITIPNSVTIIAAYAFEGCSSLTSMTIGNSVTSIDRAAFYGCSGLTSVTIPNSVTYIGDEAFRQCSSLTSVTIEAETPPTLGSGSFSDTNNSPIYVPCNAVNTYKAAWSNYANRIRGNNCASSYTIQFVNWDGSVLQSKQVEEGKMPQYTGATPTKPSDSQYNYTFSGWTPQIVAATADATYTATFTDTPRNQGVEDVLSDQVQCTKVLRDGQVLILRGGKVYTVTGQEVQ